MNRVNAPQLRFPGFEGEWESNKMEEMAQFKAGYAFKSEQMLSKKSNYQLLKMSNVYQNELRLDRNPSFWKTIDAKQKEFLLKKGDSILTLTGTVGKKDYGYSIKIEDDNKFLLNQRLVLLREIQNKSDNSFISYLISNERFLFYFFAEAKGGTGNQTNVSTEDVKNIKLNFPSLPEQQKIASFLSAVDEKIQQLSRKKELLEQYKKGVMQQLFSGKLRFKDENGEDYADWEEKKLGECLDYIQPTKYLVTSTEYDNSFTTPVLTAGKTFILGYTNETKGIFENNLPVIIFDDFTTATKFVDFPFKAKSSAMKILVPFKDVNIKFIYEAMQIMKYEIGGHERHWISKFSQILMPFPCIPEQQKIANFLSGIDGKIEQVNGELVKTQIFKKGLLQKMFV